MTMGQPHECNGLQPRLHVERPGYQVCGMHTCTLSAWFLVEVQKNRIRSTWHPSWLVDTGMFSTLVSQRPHGRQLTVQLFSNRWIACAIRCCWAL